MKYKNRSILQKFIIFMLNFSNENIKTKEKHGVGLFKLTTLTVFGIMMLIFSILIIIDIIHPTNHIKGNRASSRRIYSYSDFSTERAKFKTTIINKGPAPQEYEEESPPEGIKEIFYDSGDLKLKAWLTDDPGDGRKYPAVVFAHGGFAGLGDPELFYYMWNDDFILMTPTYRGENGNPGYFECFYGEVDDLTAAGDYLASLPYVDRDSIYLVGFSSGGTLSMLTALRTSCYKKIVSIGGCPDIKIYDDKDLYVFNTRNPREFNMRSPVFFDKSLKNPLLIILGNKEKYFMESTKKFVHKAKKAQKQCDLLILPGDHFSIVPEAMEKALEFFQK